MASIQPDGSVIHPGGSGPVIPRRTNAAGSNESDLGAGAPTGAPLGMGGGARLGGRPLAAPPHKDITLWQWYLKALAKRPLLVKSITTGVLMGVGNVAAQGVVIVKGKQRGIVMRKVIAFVMFGLLLSGPLGHAWLKFLNGRKNKLKGQTLILYKIALDRLVYGPAFNLLQMAFVYKASGQSWNKVGKSLAATWWPAQILNWKMWPFAQFINFNFIPPDLQLLYMNLVALIWTVALSSIMN
mmetsp:Transcript_16125/g.32292  ORF Transcript_16125/g.32292 Transcript_16125/m.32292 type:complete len:241 (-) Transcript_16125:269-991(-)|eukprot:CAMPEP_0181288550 /NCGR_PEP_ID=MMETSP1101-20121128/394_1 /TAXON_ID=46948 /ORGANISM="Rhodomonas abbreviata, Strain Caron Lab Isolate" /LENGTH=240 /DNA_ID=CAMNT_0023392683 /DNA_START=159 /DNA_END=881 /DNA_ORIENTATION=+